MIELFEYAKGVGNGAANNLFNLKQKLLPHKIKSKEDSSPLYNFDLLMDEFICSKLIKTGVQIVSEESYKKGQILNSEYWIVDPIDRSKEINSKKGIMTINISFVKNNYPVFGVINVINTTDYSSQQYSGFVKSTVQYQHINSVTKKPLKKIKLIISKYHLNDFDKKFIKINMN